MSHFIKIYSLLIGSALLMFGGGLQGLVLSVRGAEEHFSLLALGLIGTGWSVGFVAGSITVPMMVKRVGHIRAYSVMAAIGTITILCNLLWINDVAWILLRALSGYCFAGAAMIVESWLNEVTDNKSRGTIFSSYSAINMAASTLGQLAMSLTGVVGYLPFVIGAISFICALLPTALTTKPQPRPLQSAKMDLKLLYRTSPVAAIAAFSVGMANGTFGTLAPVYGYSQNMDAAGISYLMCLVVICGAISQIPAGRVSDRMDRRKVIIALAAVAAVIGVLLVVLNPQGSWLLYVLFAIYGLCAYPLYGIAVAHANDSAKDGDFAKISSAMLLIMGVGLAIGPAIAPILMNTIRPVAMFIVTATFHGALAISTLARMRARPTRRNLRSRFRPIWSDKGQTPEVVTLDPAVRISGRRAGGFVMAANFKAAERFADRAFVQLGIGIVTVSDTRTAETDTSGALLQSLLEADGHRCGGRVIVKDDRQAIRAAVQNFVVDPAVQVVITTGGTGFSGRDVTPEAVEPLFEKRMEGFSVLFHQYSATTVGTSSLQSRATAGLIGETFVFCLPGSRGACRDAWDGILTHQLDYRHAPCNFIELMPRLTER